MDTGPADQANAIAVDAAGNVLGAGILDNQFALMKFRRVDGLEQWRRSLGDSEPGSAWAVSADAGGDVVVAGQSGLSVFTVAKLARADGADLWVKQIHGSRITQSNPDVARAVTVDGSGNVIAGGQLNNIVLSPDFTVVKLRGTDGAELWRYGNAAFGVARTVKVDGAGDVVAAGGSMLVKLRGTTGAELWRRSSGDISINRIALDASGDVVAVGISPFIVMKLSGATGAQLWRRDLHGDLMSPEYDEAIDVATDGSGNVVAGGRMLNATTPHGGSMVIKLDGDDGTELWRHGIGPGFLYALALDSADNVAAAGNLAQNSEADLIVAKVRGADGAELWRHTLDGTAGGDMDDDQARAVAVDTVGDVAAAGFTNNAGKFSDFTVLKLFGTNGADAGPSCGNGILETGETCDDNNVVDGDGCSALCSEEGNPESVTASATPGIPVTTDGEMDGATSTDPIETSVTSPNAGTVSISEQPLSGGFTQFLLLGREVQVSAPPASVLDPLVLVFRLDASRLPEGEDETTIQIFRNGLLVPACTGASGTASADPCVSNRAALFDGDIEISVLSSMASLWTLGVRLQAQLIEGTKLLITDRADTSKRKVVFKSVAPNLSMAVPGSGNDPTCAHGGGARMELFNTAGSGERAVFDLPCEHWSVLGAPGKEKGYRYKDKDLVSGPVGVVLIKNRKKISVVAKGSQIAYSLDEPSQGSIGVVLRMGTSTSYCTQFVPGTIARDEPGHFSGKGAAAPAVCP